MRKLLPIVGAAVLALLVGLGAGWYVKSAAAPAAAAEDAEHQDKAEKPHYKEYVIKDRVVNLADPGARRYLKVSMVLQVSEVKAKAGQPKTDGKAAKGDGSMMVLR